jgi:uncharacterized OB-fold protein
MENWLPEIPNTLAENQGEIRLTGSKCASCQRVYFPPLKICPDCLDDGQPLQSVFLSKTGTISSYSVAQVAPSGYESPHVQAYIKMEEGVKIFTLMIDCGGGTKIANNMPAEMVVISVGENEDGAKLLSYRFTPAPREGQE